MFALTNVTTVDAQASGFWNADRGLCVTRFADVDFSVNGFCSAFEQRLGGLDHPDNKGMSKLQALQVGKCFKGGGIRVVNRIRLQIEFQNRVWIIPWIGSKPLHFFFSSFVLSDVAHCADRV